MDGNTGTRCDGEQTNVNKLYKREGFMKSQTTHVPKGHGTWNRKRKPMISAQELQGKQSSIRQS